VRAVTSLLERFVYQGYWVKIKVTSKTASCGWFVIHLEAVVVPQKSRS